MSKAPEDIVNFAAGPAKLPREVLLEAQVGALNWEGTGIGVMELSHRSKQFNKMHLETLDLIRRLLAVPDNFKILLLSGGGTGQFAAIPLNLTQSSEETVDYLVTGQWSNKAAKEAEKYVRVNTVFPKLSQFTGIPDQSQWSFSENSSYVYYCDNETVHGVEFPSMPDVGGRNLVCDVSSNFLTRPIDFSKYVLVFAGAQKNVGCAGVTIVIVREDVLGKPRKTCPTIIDYTAQDSANSLYNTPCVWATYILGLVLKWVEKQGGVKAMQANSEHKSQMLYDTIGKSQGFYSLVVQPAYRSRVNVPFRAGYADQGKVEEDFLKRAEERGLVQLKGHRSVGGLRASLYNAMSVSEVEKLVAFMNEFMRSQCKEE